MLPSDDSSYRNSYLDSILTKEHGAQAISLVLGQPYHPLNLAVTGEYLKQYAKDAYQQASSAITYSRRFSIAALKAEFNIPLILALKEYCKEKYHTIRKKPYEPKTSVNIELAKKLWQNGDKSDAYTIFLTPEPCTRDFFNPIYKASGGNKHPIVAPLVTPLLAAGVFKGMGLVAAQIIGYDTTAGCLPTIYFLGVAAASAPIIKTKLKDRAETKESIGSRLLYIPTADKENENITLEGCMQEFHITQPDGHDTPALRKQQKRFSEFKTACKNYQSVQTPKTYTALIERIMDNNPMLLSAHTANRLTRIIHKHNTDDTNENKATTTEICTKSTQTI